jgi:hypothetical protein
LIGFELDGPALMEATARRMAAQANTQIPEADLFMGCPF